VATKSEIAKTKPRNGLGKFVKYQKDHNLTNALTYKTAANSTFIAMPEIQPPMPPNPAVSPIAPGVYHVNVYRAIASTPGGMYRNLDESLRTSPQTAKAMLNDISIVGPLFQRWMSLASYNDGLYPDDENDPEQVAICEEIMQDIENIPLWTEFKRNLMLAAWYGKTANVIDWTWDYSTGKQKLAVRKWINILGDKLVFRNNGRMGYLVHMPTGYRDVIYTDRGMAELFMPEDKDCVVHHKYFITDTTWDESLLAIGIEGFGYRHYLYWTYWLKMQVLEWALNAFQIFGAGGLRIGYFEQSNKESEEAVSKAMAMANGQNIILFPRPIGDEKQGAGLEVISPQGLDLNHFEHFIDDYFGKQINSMILGFDYNDKREDYYRLQCYDAAGLGETITRDLVSVIIKYNYPQAMGLNIKYRISVPYVDTEGYLTSVQRAYELGLPLSQSEVYAALGFTMPSKKKKVLTKPINAMMRELRPEEDVNYTDDNPENNTIRSPKKNVGSLLERLS
jgi:hypothetical protein